MSSGRTSTPIGAASVGFVECAAPLFKLEEGSARLQALRPGRRQSIEAAAASGGVAEEAAHAILAQPIEQDVGQGGAGLAFPRRQSRHAVREMQWQTRVDRQDQHVVVPIFSGGGADGDLVRPGAARRDEFADPPQGLDCLGARRGAGDDLRQRRCRPRIGAKLAGEPGGIGIAGIAPAEPHLVAPGQ